MSQDEDWMTKGRFLSPPAGPIALVPRATYRAEHVPTHDRCADTRSPFREELVVDPLISAFIADHLTPAASGEDPFVELSAADPQRMVEILVGSRGVTVERDRKVAHE